MFLTWRRTIIINKHYGFVHDDALENLIEGNNYKG